MKLRNIDWERVRYKTGLALPFSLFFVVFFSKVTEPKPGPTIEDNQVTMMRVLNNRMNEQNEQLRRLRDEVHILRTIAEGALPRVER